MTFHVFYKDNQSEANVIADFSPGKKQSFKIQKNVDEKGRNSVWSHIRERWYTLIPRSPPPSMVPIFMRLVRKVPYWREMPQSQY